MASPKATLSLQLKQIKKSNYAIQNEKFSKPYDLLRKVVHPELLQEFVSVNPRAVSIAPGDLNCIPSHRLHLQRLEVFTPRAADSQRIGLNGFAQGAGATRSEVLQRVSTFLPVGPMNSQGGIIDPVKLGARVVVRQ